MKIYVWYYTTGYGEDETIIIAGESPKDAVKNMREEYERLGCVDTSYYKDYRLEYLESHEPDEEEEFKPGWFRIESHTTD